MVPALGFNSKRRDCHVSNPDPCCNWKDVLDCLLLIFFSSHWEGCSHSGVSRFPSFSPKDADLLDVESKHFEDLEFQQLEHESRLDEEKENLTQQLLREVAEYQRNIVTRKVLLPDVVQCKKSKYTPRYVTISINIAITFAFLFAYLYIWIILCV